MIVPFMSLLKVVQKAQKTERTPKKDDLDSDFECNFFITIRRIIITDKRGIAENATCYWQQVKRLVRFYELRGNKQTGEAAATYNVQHRSSFFFFFFSYFKPLYCSLVFLW